MKQYCCSAVNDCSRYCNLFSGIGSLALELSLHGSDLLCERLVVCVNLLSCRGIKSDIKTTV